MSLLPLELRFLQCFRQIYSRHSGKVPLKIAIALSGGLDSMCATHLLHKINQHEKLGIQIHTISIDHGLREESLHEIAFIRDQITKLGIHETFHPTKIDLSELAPGQSFEEPARNKRYDALHKICQTNQIHNLITAHHYDDNIETFTLRLLSGSGVLGLRGISKVSPAPLPTSKANALHKLSLIRPLLDFTKDELYEYAKGNDIKWVEDHTNKLEVGKRNIIRSYLRQNPQKKERLILLHNEVLNFTDEVEHKVNAMYHEMKADNRFSDTSNGFKQFKIKFDKKTLQQSSDLVITRFLFKLLYPYSASSNYHYLFHKAIKAIPSIRQNKKFTLLKLEWTFEDEDEYTIIIVERQARIPSKEGATERHNIFVSAKGESDWVLFDNIYWLKLFNNTSIGKEFVLRNAYNRLQVEKNVINDKKLILENKGLPFVYNRNCPGEDFYFPTHNKNTSDCKWTIKENIYNFD